MRNTQKTFAPNKRKQFNLSYQFGIWHLTELSEHKNEHWQLYVAALTVLPRVRHSTDSCHPTTAIIHTHMHAHIFNRSILSRPTKANTFEIVVAERLQLRFLSCRPINQQQHSTDIATIQLEKVALDGAVRLRRDGVTLTFDLSTQKRNQVICVPRCTIDKSLAKIYQ